jgi:hypothetical protein
MDKLMKGCVALAALTAFAVLPTSAFALNSATLTLPTGTSLAPTHASPVTLVTKNVGNTRSTDAEGNTLTECVNAEARGNLETNTHTVIEGTITSAKVWGTPGNPTSEHCSSSLGNTTLTTNVPTNGLPWCLQMNTTMSTDTGQLRGGGCTEAARPIRGNWHIQTIFGKVTCVMERSTPIVGTFPTHPNPAEQSFSKIEFTRLEGSAICPVKIFLDLKLAAFRETAGGALDPLWISKSGT